MNKFRAFGCRIKSPGKDTRFAHLRPPERALAPVSFGVADSTSPKPEGAGPRMRGETGV